MPVYASPGVKLESDMVAPRHVLALAKSSTCQILNGFKDAERQSNSRTVYIDPLLRKSYKTLAPLP